MKKSWFITLIILTTLILVGIGIYFFFPNISLTQPNEVKKPSSLFGSLDSIDTLNGNTENNQNNSIKEENNQLEEPAEKPIGFVAKKIGDYLVSSVQPLDFKTGTTSTTTLLLSVGKDMGTLRLYNPQSDESTIVGSLAIPNIIMSEFTRSGKFVVVQSQDNEILKTFILQSTQPQNMFGERFFTPIFSSVNAPGFFIDGETIYLIEKIRSGTELYVYNPNKKIKTLIYRGLFSNIYGYARNGTLFLGTKPLSGADGFLFELNTKNSTLNKIRSGKGIVGIPDQTGVNILVTSFFGSNTTVETVSLKDKVGEIVSLSTWKDKCTPDFSSRSFMFCGGISDINNVVLPEQWYMGKISTNDSLYLIDIANQSFDVLATTSEPVDVLDPHSSSYSGILTFINKRDFTPWIVFSN